MGGQECVASGRARASTASSAGGPVSGPLRGRHGDRHRLRSSGGNPAAPHTRQCHWSAHELFTELPSPGAGVPLKRPRVHSFFPASNGRTSNSLGLPPLRGKIAHAGLCPPGPLYISAAWPWTWWAKRRGLLHTEDQPSIVVQRARRRPGLLP